MYITVCILQILPDNFDNNVNHNGRTQTPSSSTASVNNRGPLKKLSDTSTQSVDSDILTRTDSVPEIKLKPTRGSDASQISDTPRRKRGILEPLAPFESARSTEADLTKYEKDEQ